MKRVINLIISGQSPELLRIVIAPTLKCNYNCTYCFENDGRDKVSMSEEVLYKTVEYIRKIVETTPSIKTVFITWFGGEPLLELKSIIRISEKLIPWLKSIGLNYGSKVITNASLLNTNTIKILKEKCKVESMQITLDGMAETYARMKGCSVNKFDQVIGNIKAASRQFRIVLRLNIDADNAEEMKKVVKYIASLNLYNVKVYFAQIKDWNNEKRNFIIGEEYIKFLHDIFIESLQKGWYNIIGMQRPTRMIGPCGLLSESSMVIGPNGMITRCDHCIGKEEWNIGSVFNGKVDNESNKKFLHAELYDRCSECKAFPLCQGGCVAEKVLHNNDNIINCENYINVIREKILFDIGKKRKSTIN